MLRRAQKRGFKGENLNSKKTVKPIDVSLESEDNESPEEDEKRLEVLVFGNTLETSKKNDCDKEDKSSLSLKEAWVDEDDTQGSDLVDKPTNKLLSEKMRQNQFKESVGLIPSWAKIKYTKDEDPLITESHDYTVLSETLPSDSLSFIQLKDANYKNAEDTVHVCEFHRSAQISLIVSNLYRLGLFQVDGKSNSKLHSLYLENFPIKSAHFLQNGEEIVLASGMQKHMYSYNLVSGKLNKIKKLLAMNKNEYVKNFKVSPDNDNLAVLSTKGTLYLLSSKTKETIATLKASDSIQDISFFGENNNLLSLANNGVVHAWDMRMQSCFHSFSDDSMFAPLTLAASKNEKFIACGSESGIVSLYDSTCLTFDRPKPIKEFKNIRTPISSLIFNSESEILGMSSAEMNNAIKLVHLNSQTVYSNFPIQNDKISNSVKSIDFSPNSGYMMTGNRGGRVLLYRLHHYQGY